MKRNTTGLILLLVLFLFMSVSVDNSGATAIYDGYINFDMNVTQIIVTNLSGQSSIQFSSIGDVNQYTLSQLGVVGIEEEIGGITIGDQYADAISPDSANSGYSLLTGTSVASGSAVNDFVQSGIFLDGLWRYASAFADNRFGNIEMIFSYTYSINVTAAADSSAEYAMIDAWLVLETWDALGQMPIVDALGGESTVLGSMSFWPDSETGSGTFSIILNEFNSFADITMRADLWGQAQGSPVPEPSTFILFGLGCVFAAARYRQPKG